MSDYDSNNSEKQVKETVPRGLRIGCSQREFPTLKAHSIIVWKKRATTILLCQMNLSLSVCHQCQSLIFHVRFWFFVVVVVPLWKVSSLHL